jgi:hypothetical protein
VFRVAADEHVLLVAMHPIAADAWSLTRLPGILRSHARPVVRAGNPYSHRCRRGLTVSCTPA